MLEWYSSGMPMSEIADRLATPEWQEYWVAQSGSEFRPHKVSVNVVLRQAGCQIRTASERTKGRHPACKPWPIQQMTELYQGGLSLEVLAERLCSPEWQAYWIAKTGAEYHPSQKVVNKVLKKHIQLRGKGSPGAKNGSWKGGIRIDRDGYRLTYCPDHPLAASNGCVREHRLVMERTIGRYLTAVEVVHHKDDDKSNNHPDNLELFADNSAHIVATTRGISRPSKSRSMLRHHTLAVNSVLADARDTMFRTLHAAGLTIPQMSDLLQIHKNTASATLGRLGCSGRPSKRAEVPDLLREECRLLLAKLDQSIADARA